MELAAELRRLPRLVLFTLIVISATSCARTTGVDPSDELASAPQTLSADTESLTQPETRRVITSARGGAPEMELLESSSSNELRIATTASEDQIAIERLENPTRLVIDLPATNQPGDLKSATYQTEGAQYLSRIRVGAHPDKTRIVLDLPEVGAPIQAQLRQSDGGIVVRMTGSDSATTQTAALVPSAVTESKSVETTESIAPAAVAEEASVRPEPELVSEESSSTTAKSVTAPAPSVTLEGIHFEQVSEKQNQMLVELDSAGFYSLKRTAPSEYVLRVEGARLGESVEPAAIAKPGSGKIRSVRAAQDMGDVVLRIFSAPDVALKAESRSGGISVKAVGLTSVPSDSHAIRAQYAPDETAPAAVPAIGNNGVAEFVAAKDPTSGDKKAEGSAPDTTAADTSKAEAAPVPGDDLAALLGDQQYTGRLISLDLQDTDIDNALRIIAEVSNLNIVTTEDVAGKVTLRLIDVPWDQALDVILKINGLGKVQEGNVVRIAPLEKLRAEREALRQAKQAEDQLEELKVRYIRVSYARAADMKPLVDTVVSERGTVSYDERSNQLIIKDTRAGISRVVELVKKLDLRTPQVLLETQIVESSRGFLRNLGAELNFTSRRGPATGNATGWNFPNSINGNFQSNNGLNDPTSPGIFDILLGSADGTRNLDIKLQAAENEGIAKVVSRPSVATTNNKEAIIKSVQRLRVRLPGGNNNVSVGNGAQGAGAMLATEIIEAGIVLEVTPQASPDYYVLLDLNAKSSTLDRNNSVDGIPTEIERSATSTILVSSGQTFVLGGIYKVVESQSIRGIPFLKDVPFIGTMFRRSLIEDSDEELLFFITPRIIEGSFDDAAMKSAQ